MGVDMVGDELNSVGEDLNDLLRQGIAAAKAGQHERASEILMRVVAVDERNLLAWLWLSGVVDSLDDREICLENVLAIDPHHAAARKGLAWVRQQKAAQEASTASSAAPFTPSAEPDPPALEQTEPEDGFVDLGAGPPSGVNVESSVFVTDAEPPSGVPPLVKMGETPITPASAMLGKDFAARVSAPPEDEEEPEVPSPLEDAFGDEYMCPYCGYEAEPEDRQCRSCRRSLWIKFRKQKKRSRLLWILIGFQFISTMWSAFLPFLALGYVWAMVTLQDFPPTSLETFQLINPLEFVKLYFWLSHDLSPSIQQQALTILPRFLFFLSFVPMFFSGTVLVGLYMRWRAFYYLLLLDALFGVASAIVAFASLQSLLSLIVGLGFALVRAALIFQLDDQFLVERRRILLRPDRTCGNRQDYLVQANYYNRQKMYAMAAVHLRCALSLMPSDVATRLSLVASYIRLGRYELAERELDVATEAEPSNPRVQKLDALLKELKAQAAGG